MLERVALHNCNVLPFSRSTRYDRLDHVGPVVGDNALAGAVAVRPAERAKIRRMGARTVRANADSAHSARFMKTWRDV